MNLFDFGQGRRRARTDGPDRLIGDGERLALKGVRQAVAQLAGDDLDSRARVTLLAGFPKAEDRLQPGLQRRARLGGDLGAGFGIGGPTLRMADNDHRRACIMQHLA